MVERWGVLYEKDDPLHYASSLITMILNTKGQELATHTFSHYYCTEPGQNVKQFEADLKAAQFIANENFGLQFKSLVFPRNQFNKEYLEVAFQQGIRVIRSNPNVWFWTETKGMIFRLCRAADTLISISNSVSFKNEDIKNYSGVTLLPSSRFFRPYKPKEKLIQGAKINRIKREMSYAAKNARNYHLWWHPHNFGEDINKNIAQLKDIINHYNLLNKEYSFISSTIGDYSLE